MKRIASSSEDEMILEFLAMELESERFRDEITRALAISGAGVDVIRCGNCSNAEENALRREVLGTFRGYGKNEGLFENFPADVRWEWALLEGADLPKIRYINYSYWNELSRFTGSPIEAACAIEAGMTVFDVPNDGFQKAVESLRSRVILPPLIFLTDSGTERYFLVEGHVRATAYALAPEYFRNIRALVGCCDTDALMKWYGVMPTP